MAIYHCSISNVSRAKGSSSCATLSYISGRKIYEERTAQAYSYGRIERVLDVGTVIPENAPEEFRDPSVLFNSIESFEKTENARTAKKIEVALPREIDIDEQKEIVENFIKENLTKEGYACTYAIHNDKDNNNPHAHILVANRQINKNGEWGSKRKMGYALDEDGNRIPRLDKNGQQKTDKNGRKQWVRVNVEQNILDKKEFLMQLREMWAMECNKYLDKENHIDHRSYEEQGIDKIPTIHEGYASREIEIRGGVSERAEINRIIMANNGLIKELTDKLKAMAERVKEKGSETHDKIRELLQRSRDARAEQGTGTELERQGEIDGGELEAFIANIKSQVRNAESGRKEREAERSRQCAEAKRRAEEKEQAIREREASDKKRSRGFDFER